MADAEYLVLARKWRPQTFEEVVGQEHITRALQNAIASHRIGHAFLFIGSRGIGKTTTARILAKALNCESVAEPTPHPCGECDNCRTIAAGNSIDVIEIDGASNNSVDNVREIREHIRLMPVRSRYKVYVIDEVHQLSIPAFNALLKTLEEPPPHAIFILATTEAHKVPATIISRCQRYDFRRVPVDRVLDLLREIVKKEGVQCSDDALRAISRAAEGAVRDAESILEQLISYCQGEITLQDVLDVLGLIDWQVLHRLGEAIADKDIAAQLSIVEEVATGGGDLSQFLGEILQYFRNLLVCKTADAARLIHLPADELARIEETAKRFSLTEIIRFVEAFAALSRDFDSQLAQRIALEALLIRSAKLTVEVSVSSIIEQLMNMKEGGAPFTENPSQPASPAPSRSQRPQAEKAPAAKPFAASVDRDAAAGDAPVPRPTEAACEDSKGGVAVTQANAGAVWERIKEHVAKEANLWLATQLGYCSPQVAEDNALILAFGPNHGDARRLVEQPANRAVLESVLARLTRNITTFRTETGKEEPESRGQEGQDTLPFGGKASGETAQAVLKDPHIAKVVETFKGRVVEVRQSVGSAEQE